MARTAHHTVTHRQRRLRVVDARELCQVCMEHKAQQHGMCGRCWTAYTDLAVFDAQVDAIREAGRK